MKKVTFYKADQYAGITGNDPIPAVKSLPNWYKKMPKTVNGSHKPQFNGFGDPDLTVKACPPFLDAMMSGYIINLEFDIHVSIVNEEPYFEWAGGGTPISKHNTMQVVPEQIPAEFSHVPQKWINRWIIKTPKNYSSIITHPMNRTDLPFYTISAIVETDKYENVVNFPFLIRKDFTGIIPAGTPIAQIIPLKREVWQSFKSEFSKEQMEINVAKLKSKMIHSYKTQWWVRKEYK